jgi:hypothetical protein
VYNNFFFRGKQAEFLKKKDKNRYCNNIVGRNKKIFNQEKNLSIANIFFLKNNYKFKISYVLNNIFI